MDLITIIQIFDSALRLATPLLFACLAGLFSERSGIFDIGLEGKMLASAFMAASVAAFSGNVWIGLLGGVGASVFLAMVHGVASITFRGNQLISGVAINFLASGTTVVIGETWFGLGGRTPQLDTDKGERFAEITLPFAEALRDVPVIGPIYYELISGHTILVYIALLSVLLTWWLLFRTRFGLRLRAVGENPESVDTAGVNVIHLRFTAVAICGVLCGLAGTYLSTGLSAGFVKEMSALRGFIALAALIFAKWRPGYALMACLLFGLLEAVANRYQSISLPAWWVILTLLILAAGLAWGARKSRLDMAVMGTLAVVLVAIAVAVWASTGFAGVSALPVQFMQALPYILTVVILAGFVGKAIPPRAGGEPYVKER